MKNPNLSRLDQSWSHFLAKLTGWIIHIFIFIGLLFNDDNNDDDDDDDNVDVVRGQKYFLKSI